ncbi:MAG: hypothetical protein R2847_08730 [Bacteroidia bacterium]
MFDYLPQEIGVKLLREPKARDFNGSKFLIGHGDGLGPEIMDISSLKKFLPINFVSGCLPDCIPILVLVWLISGAVKAGNIPAIMMPLS